MLLFQRETKKYTAFAVLKAFESCFRILPLPRIVVINGHREDQ